MPLLRGMADSARLEAHLIFTHNRIKRFRGLEDNMRRAYDEEGANIVCACASVIYSL